MKNNEANAFVFIASVILGILIAMNISFNKSHKRVVLSAKQYQEAYNQRNKLHNDISDLIEEYKKNESKIKKYKNSNKNYEEIMQEINSEVSINNLILGVTDVTGPGIKIVLEDASVEFVNDPFEYKSRLIHDRDIIQVINDLKNAGAEALSINDQRIINSTEVYCNGPFLRVNGVKIVAPFYIYAIGNAETMKNYMLSNENYLKGMIIRKINVSITEENNIVIPAYNGKMLHKYLKLN
ncbi:hypothetical protein CLOACE_01590 [Clostridium acetireducens DSM 10703]|jgi:uncharacterized protein YlxW (UPF0749 family)|uniref:Division initiation protein n=1 Tax=Clostridium acetireducens DSM 10703 TaxID=1121290 RepID=A0A1E8F1Q8_9CLOT|nr:DUF881 domain-containing protein [Clostridium acetireducens]OFI07555.1 hypothetical protein CLOACE_01590 [Clostridium acetireducens DSM 10703]